MNILRVLSTCFLWWIFAIWQYCFSKEKPLCWFWYFQQPSHLSLCLYNKCIVTPLFRDKTNTVIQMWDAVEYAIHMHYTQFFLKIHWNFKQVTWTWNQFIFQFWKLLLWNQENLFVFEYESSYLNSENYYFNLKNWFTIM